MCPFVLKQLESSIYSTKAVPSFKRRNAPVLEKKTMNRVETLECHIAGSHSQSVWMRWQKGYITSGCFDLGYYLKLACINFCTVC